MSASRLAANSHNNYGTPVISLAHFGAQPRPMRAELSLLSPGRCTVDLLDAKGGKVGSRVPPLEVKGPHPTVVFQLPPRQLCVLRITPE